MRARGASVTDIVVLVVAADDGLMPQTIEAINHAKAAPQVKIMVAINKIDLASANIDRAKKQLQERDLTPEDWGGETITVPVSATRGTNIDQLLEMMALQAEVMELKASPTAKPRGTVIEAQVEAGRGPTATVIVQMGTLRVGDAFICGDYSGKVKSLIDDRGQPVKALGHRMPVKVLGFTGLPNAGDELLVMDSEREAKQLSEERLEAKTRGQTGDAAARHARNFARSDRRQESLADRAEDRRPRLVRSAHWRAQSDSKARKSISRSSMPASDRFQKMTFCWRARPMRLSSVSTSKWKTWR
jgi:translation initiation factor IF-2